MSIDRHGASSCGSPGGHAAAGPESPSTATPPPAGSYRTEITRPVPVHRAHAASGPPPRDACRCPVPGTSGSGPRHGPKSGGSKATAMRRPADLLENPARPIGGRARLGSRPLNPSPTDRAWRRPGQPAGGGAGAGGRVDACPFAGDRPGGAGQPRPAAHRRRQARARAAVRPFRTVADSRAILQVATLDACVWALVATITTSTR